METAFSLKGTLRALVISALSAVLLILFYAWGFIYHQTHLNGWGFDASRHELSTPQVYSATYFVVIQALLQPLKSLEQIFSNPRPVLGAAAVVLLLMTYWFVWKKAQSRNPLTSKPLQRPSGRIRRSVVGIALYFVILLGLVLIPLFVAVLAALMVFQPVELAQSRVLFERQNCSYLAWPSVKWKNDEGVERNAHLLECSAPWCAITDGQVALDVPASEIRYIASSTNRQATTTKSLCEAQQPHVD